MGTICGLVNVGVVVAFFAIDQWRGAREKFLGIFRDLHDEHT